MSLTRRAPSQALLLSLRSSANPSLRCFHITAFRREATKSQVDTSKSFRGQLLESTQRRIERSNKDQERIARQRDSAGAGRNVALTATIILVAVGGYLYGLSSAPSIPESSTFPINATTPPRHNTGGGNLEASWADFVQIVCSENVSTNADDLEQHAGSEWSTHVRTSAEKPFLVVYPATTDEVSRVMKICHRRRIPVTAYSGGTSLEGHYAPTKGGICIDFSRMDKILTLHKEDMDVIVQPAVGWEYLNDELAKENLFFPPDPGPGAMIGGMVGTGCSGTNSYRYGTMREWVLSLTVVMADGTIVKTRQRPRKSSAGYDLTKLFIGSEGTLGLITEATLKVTPRPQSASVAVCSFGSIRQAADCAGKVVSVGVPIAAIEILDDNQMHAINSRGSTKPWLEAPTLFFKFAGTTSGVKEQIATVKALASKSGSKTFEFAKNEQEKEQLWSARKDALWATMAMRKDPSERVITTDVAVPISRLPDIIEETKESIKNSGLFASIVGHVGDGNFHAIMLYGEGERKKAEQVVHKMVNRAVEMEGTVTGEHGVGLVKRDYLQKELGVEAVDLMRRLKLAFDPLCILNCDKVVRVQKPAKGEVAKW